MVQNGRTLSWYQLVVSFTSTGGSNLLLDSECLSFSGWVMMQRPCIVNGSSRPDSAESSLAYIANLLAAPYYRQATRPTLLEAKHEASSRIDCSACLCFLCESNYCNVWLFDTKILRHSKGGSTTASTATLSPVEQQGGFSQLSTINEDTPRTGDTLSASTVFMDEKESSAGPAHSWLTSFLVDAHLSAPSRRWGADSNGGSTWHA